MKYIFSLILLLAGVSGMKAQTIKDVILSIPDNIITGLSMEQKEQLCEGVSNDSVSLDTVIIANALNGELKRDMISSDFVEFQTSEVGTLQIKVLPLVNDSKILCVVKTVCSDACDSRIQFYTMDWKLLPEQNLIPRRTFDWFVKPDADRESTDYKDAVKAVDMNPMTFSLSPDDLTLNVDSELENYLSSEDYDELKPFLITEPKVFVWDKSSFKVQNKQ